MIGVHAVCKRQNGGNYSQHLSPCWPSSLYLLQRVGFPAPSLFCNFLSPVGSTCGLSFNAR